MKLHARHLRLGLESSNPKPKTLHHQPNFKLSFCTASHLIELAKNKETCQASGFWVQGLKVWGLGLTGLEFRGLGFRGLGFRGLGA